MIILVKPSQNNQRLDILLTGQLKISRNQIQRLIKAGRILGNNNIVPPHYFLKANDTIKIADKEVDKIKAPKLGLAPNPKVKFKIVYEDANISVIEKPSGLVVHPTEQMEAKTLAAGLLAKYPEIKNVGDDPLRPGIVHRLDKSVSGLMIVCKTQKAFEYFKKQFQNRRIKKVYTALVYGKMERIEGIIDLPIDRSTTKGKMAVKSKEQGGKEAITKYNLTKQFDNFSLLEVEIKTGRTHQIRAHLNAIQHPVVGDKLYAQKWVKEKLELDRPFLHSSYLSFKNLDGKKLEFKSKLPSKLSRVLKELK